MGLLRHAQSDSKQQVRMNLDKNLIRMYLGVKLIIGMRLGMHKYIYLIQLINMGIVKHTWIFQK